MHEAWVEQMFATNLRGNICYFIGAQRTRWKISVRYHYGECGHTNDK